MERPASASFPGVLKILSPRQRFSQPMRGAIRRCVINAGVCMKRATPTRGTTECSLRSTEIASLRHGIRFHPLLRPRSRNSHQLLQPLKSGTRMRRSMNNTMNNTIFQDETLHRDETTKWGQPCAVERTNVLGTGVHAVNMKQTIALIRQAIEEDRKEYICLAGAHGIMEAHRNPDLKHIAANAFLVLPDGMPTVWFGRLRGLSKMDRVFGPDLMAEILGCRELSHLTHFFCGGAPGVAEQLRDEMMRRFPAACICRTFN